MINRARILHSEFSRHIAARERALLGQKVKPWLWKNFVLTPLWTVAALVILSMLYAPAYSTLTTAGVIFLYVSYVMPTAAGFFAYGKRWTKMGPFTLGKSVFKTLAVISVLGVILLLWIGVQPPNGKALIVTLATVGSLVAGWWLGVRTVFRGPPIMSVASRNTPPEAESIEARPKNAGSELIN
jgi:amino acid transporter